MIVMCGGFCRLLAFGMAFRSAIVAVYSRVLLRAGFILVLGGGIGLGAPCENGSDTEKERYGIKFAETFDPAKRPILFIHGLLSDSDTWDRMIAALQSDPEFSKHYQCWFYDYESGTPTIGSAALLKLELDETIRKIEKAHGISMERRLVVIGHSLGGILAKSLISDAGNRVWNASFAAPIDDFDLSDEEKGLLSTAFIYRPRTYIEKTIFLATPHRGSALAKGVTGKIASRLAPRSARFDRLIESVRVQNHHLIQPGSECLYEHNVSSVQTLRRDSPISQMLADLPIDPEAQFHSISGVKNRRFRKGDGIVPLVSTLVPGAYCEIGIFSRHNVHQREETFELINLMIKTDFHETSDEIVIDRLSRAGFAFVRFRGLFL